jgi:hypothetical protein
MQIAKSVAVNLCILLGCSKAHKWDNHVLAGRIAQLHELFEPNMGISDPKYQSVFTEIYEMTRAGKPIDIFDDSASPIEPLIPSIDANLHMKPEVVEPVDVTKLQRTQQQVTEIDGVSNTPTDSQVDSVEQDQIEKVKASVADDKISDIYAIIKDEGEKAEQRKLRQQQKQMERKHDHGNQKRKPYSTELLYERQKNKTDWSDSLSMFGTWKWSNGYPVDAFFEEGNSGTLEMLLKTANVSRATAYRQLGLLVRSGVVVYEDESKTYRLASREERIKYIDEGAPKLFRPLGIGVAIRKWMQLQRDQKISAEIEQPDIGQVSQVG